MVQRWRIRWILVAIVAACLMLQPGANAEVLTSPNYQMDSASLGNNDNNDSSSASYGLNAALGDLAVGNSASTNFQTNSGSHTTGDPSLAFSVNSTAANFGTLSATTTGTTTSTFSVRNYTSYGYVVQVSGSAPTTSGRTIAPMSTLGPSQTGIEQFGINLVANTTPSSLGANPDNGQFGFGSITTNYNTANKYYYQDGDIIAQAVKDSGVTNYTISYILNVAPLTPGGVYTSSQTLVVTGTY